MTIEPFTVLGFTDENTLLQLQLFYSIFAILKNVDYIIYVSNSENQGEIRRHDRSSDLPGYC
ncbi:hypothetical protein MMC2321_04893 [Chitinophaga sp. MM2321]